MNKINNKHEVVDKYCKDNNLDKDYEDTDTKLLDDITNNIYFHLYGAYKFNKIKMKEEEDFYIRSGPSSVKLPVSKVLTYLEQRAKALQIDWYKAALNTNNLISGTDEG